MSSVHEMLESYPGRAMVKGGAITEAIEALLDCAQTCTACADACLAEEQVDALRRCIRLNLDCADICTTTARVLSRQTEPDPELLRAAIALCADACRLCAEECEMHSPHMRHCAICARRCRACEQACRTLLVSVGRMAA